VLCLYNVIRAPIMIYAQFPLRRKENIPQAFQSDIYGVYDILIYIFEFGVFIKLSGISTGKYFIRSKLFLLKELHTFLVDFVSPRYSSNSTSHSGFHNFHAGHPTDVLVSSSRCLIFDVITYITSL